MGPDDQRGGRDRADEALERLEKRVRHVRHLQPFEVSMREDGRFTCELGKPLTELTPSEGRAAARALEELAEFIRDSTSA